VADDGNRHRGAINGAAIGAAAGALFDAVDHVRSRQQQPQNQGYGYGQTPAPQTGSWGGGVPVQPATQAPRGRWVVVPGQWGPGGWVPAHQEWKPY
jgi:alkylation response protein AidB-like acyl-CoA dehydrogenase